MSKKNVSRDGIKMVRYPARVDAALVKKVNTVRKGMELSWPQLTTELLKQFLASKKD